MYFCFLFCFKKNVTLKSSLDSAQRHKKDMRDEYERNSFVLKKELDTLGRLRDEHMRKASSQQAALDRLQQQLEAKQAELSSALESSQLLERKARAGDLYRVKYNHVRMYFRRALYESSQMAMNSSANNDSVPGRMHFFTKVIKDLHLDAKDDDHIN